MAATAPSSEETRLLGFDGFLVDPVRRRLLRGGAPVPVTPKALSILLILLERRGEVVDKDELIRRIWPETFVTEANLTQNVSALRKVLGERANDHRYVVTAPGHGYSFVADVVEVAENAGAPAAPEETAPPPAVTGTLATTATTAIASIASIAAIAAVALFLLRPESRQAPASPEMSRPSIAVLGFRSLSGEPGSAWLAPALAEMLTTELSAGGRVRVVSGETVARARKTLDAEALDAETLRRLHSILGCDLLVTGSYRLPPGRPNGQIRLDVLVLRLPGGETAASLTEAGTGPGLFELVGRTGSELRERLGLKGLSPEQEKEARSLQPASPEAARLYTQGLEDLHAYDHLHAVSLLRKAAMADPRSASIHAALSQAWGGLGYDARAVEEARRAIELSAGLPKPERLAIQARFYEASQQWSKASAIYSSLWTFFPDDLEYGLQLATSLYTSGRGSEALATVAELRKLPPPSGLDPRIDYCEARARFRLSDLAGAVRAARAAEEKAKAAGEPLMEGQALVVAGQALTVEGGIAEAGQAFEEARALFQRAGYTWGVTTALANHGILLYRHGDLAGAERLHTQALALVRQVGNVTGLAAELGNLGLLYQSKGDLERALEYLECARTEFAEIEEPFLESRVLTASAAILLGRGDLAAARTRSEESLALARSTGSRNEEARALHNLASILVWKGQVREAASRAERAYGLVEGRRDPVQAGSSLSIWADATARTGDLSAARRRFDEALALKRQAQDRIGTGQILGSLAGLLYRQGDLAGAKAASAEQLRIARETGSRTLLFWSLQELARTQVAAGSLREARRSLELALGESTALGEVLRTMLLRDDLAALALAEGGAADAVAAAEIAGKAAAWWREKGIPWGEAQASSIQAQALAMQGRRAEALAAAARARLLIEGSEDRSLVLAVAPRLALAVALVDGGSGGEQALADVQRAAEEARRLGFVTASLEARLAQGRIEMLRGEQETGRRRIEAVREEAGSRGLALLARQADEALTPRVQPLPRV
jgi:DNA-binding winged helix-turn-helix (wHTH) protein/tetratricopeptide (TPR) repeat protein/TolB-like protein